MEDLLELLRKMNVLCRDNGSFFTDTARLDVIESELENTDYICTKGNLCRIYSRNPLGQMNGKILVVSAHVDCERSITRCFSERVSQNIIRGTYDNSITAAAVLSLMKSCSFPENVVVSFTGDEEDNSGGAIETCRILKRNGLSFRAVILDVTDEGWDRNADVSFENDFMSDEWVENVIDCIEASDCSWVFVPSDTLAVPESVPRECTVFKEAMADESWDYDEEDIECFSLCLPVSGEMHSDDGVLARTDSFLKYISVLENICRRFADDE